MRSIGGVFPAMAHLEGGNVFHPLQGGGVRSDFGLFLAILAIFSGMFPKSPPPPPQRVKRATRGVFYCIIPEPEYPETA